MSQHSFRVPRKYKWIDDMLREVPSQYVDKSDFIRELITAGAKSLGLVDSSRNTFVEQTSPECITNAPRMSHERNTSIQRQEKGDIGDIGRSLDCIDFGDFNFE